MSEKINHNRRDFLTTTVKTIAATQFAMLGCTKQHATSATPELPIEGELPSFVGAIAWLNSQPLTVDGLRGKVVLINFWTYTCINWLRQLPYVRAWAEKYKDRGLAVIGVHTPEFEFEKNIDNVRRALTEMKIDYPIAVDNDYAVWRAFGNHYWPALYFIDTQGRIRHHQFGEGKYEQSERVIQQLLSESGTSRVGQEMVEVDARGFEVAADWDSLKSPENYLGYERTENLASPAGVVLNKRHLYTVPAQLKFNQWALSGDWTIRREAIVLNKSGGRIAYRFHARDLHLVMGPVERRTSVRFRVLVDGQPRVTARGLDVDVRGESTVTEQRLYQLVRQPQPISDRQFEIEFLDSGVEAFVNMSQMTVTQMSITETTPSPQHKLHWLAEQVLAWSGLPVVTVRPTVFIEGFFLRLVAAAVRDSDELALPLDNSKTSPISAVDVARAVSAILDDPASHIGHVYNLTGFESADLNHYAHVFSEALGRTIRYRNVPLSGWTDRLREFGTPTHVVNHLAVMAELHAQGRYDRITDDLFKLIGKTPTSMYDFVKLHAAEFTPSEATA
ncbi:MAG: redoxin family protein [Nostoc sp. DedQUE11]|nr:redoxin family protein [Nostoc sp. DedQUE11]